MEFLKLEGEPVGEHVALEWGTASEVNNEIFHVMYSIDGGTEWLPAGSMQGA